MKPIIYAFLFMIPVCAFSQNEKPAIGPDEEFVYLLDGTLFRSGEYVQKKTLFGYNYFYKNGDRIKWRDIKFHHNPKGYYGRTGAGFALRAETGTFDLYYQYKPSGGYLDNDGFYQSNGSSKQYYYAKGFLDLKSFTYNNIESDFTNFPNSDYPEQEKLILANLALGKKRQKSKLIRIIAGTGVFMVGGFIWNAAQGDSNGGLSNPDETNKGQARTGLAIAAVGFGGALSALFVPKSFTSYREAMRIYNSVY